MSLRSNASTSSQALSSSSSVSRHDQPSTPARFDEEHYQALFRSIDQGFCTIEVLLDAHGAAVDYRFLDVNDAFEAQTGLRAAVGRRMRELAPAHDEHWFRIYGEIARTGEPIRFEQHARALGRWFDVYAFRVGDPSLRRVAILFSDITARRRTEEALHASEARYRALAHATANSIFRFSADGTQLLEVYGGLVAPHATSAVPSSSWLEDYVHPDDRERMREAWAAAVRNGAQFEIEVRGRFATGSWGWVFTRAVPLRNQTGAIVEWVGSSTDISARKDAEEALRRSEADHAAARRDAERANATKDEFLAMLGHELRNPLAPMMTALQLIRMRGGASREQEVLERQVKHLTRLVDDLLDVSRITRGKIELRRRRIEFSGVIGRAMEMVSPLLEERKNTVSIQVPPSGLVIDADPDRMAQVFSNLLTNAAKYSEAGSRIVVTGSRGAAVVRVSVRDYGIGISPEMLGTVFDAFVQHPQALDRASGGLGLGLAIVRSLVTAHGGSVRATSEGPQRGSEFIVELPAVDAPATVVDLEQPQTRPAASRGARPRVLVVDDNEDSANMLRAALEQLGYPVESAFDGPSALARAETFRPAVVLLDIGLPLMDGYEVARRIQSRRSGTSPRLFALTGYGLDADRQRALAAGFERHLVKPVDLDQLDRLLADERRT